MDPVHDTEGPCTRSMIRGSTDPVYILMDPVHGPGPRTRSTEGVHGPGVHVLYFPAENLAALNVDYIAWIITVLGAINGNLSFIFHLNYFLWKFKTSKRQKVSFLLKTKHKVFRFKTKQNKTNSSNSSPGR